MSYSKDFDRFFDESFDIDLALSNFLSGDFDIKAKQPKTASGFAYSSFIDEDTTNGVIEMIVPRYTKTDIEVIREGNDVKISAEGNTKLKPFNHKFRIVDKYDVGMLLVTLENGVLRLEFPLKPENVPAKVEIQ